MKKIYSTPAIRVYQVKIHQYLCSTSGTIDKRSISWEAEEDLDS